MGYVLRKHPLYQEAFNGSTGYTGLYRTVIIDDESTAMSFRAELDVNEVVEQEVELFNTDIPDWILKLINVGEAIIEQERLDVEESLQDGVDNDLSDANSKEDLENISYLSDIQGHLPYSVLSEGIELPAEIIAELDEEELQRVLDEYNESFGSDYVIEDLAEDE